MNILVGNVRRKYKTITGMYLAKQQYVTLIAILIKRMSNKCQRLFISCYLLLTINIIYIIYSYEEGQSFDEILK